MGARDYYARLGRFISPDPENAGADPASPGSWNMYAYAYNNPLMYTDPTGLAGICGTDSTSDNGADKPYCLKLLILESFLRNVESSLTAGKKLWEWASKPRDPTCLAGWTGGGSALGTGVGVFAGGPGGQPITVPTSFAVGGGVGWAAGMTACSSNSGASSGRGADEEDRQLQAKFKHAEDFGVTGNFNKANAAKFKAAIDKHLVDPATRVIHGTYRGQSVTHHVNAQTGLNVMKDSSGKFVSGWKLNPQQLQNVLTRGSL